MKKAKLPTSIQEACEMLNALLTSEEILSIKQGKISSLDLQPKLGVWISNQWIHCGLKSSNLGLNEDALDRNEDVFFHELMNYLFDYIRNE